MTIKELKRLQVLADDRSIAIKQSEKLSYVPIWGRGHYLSKKTVTTYSLYKDLKISYFQTGLKQVTNFFKYFCNRKCIIE